MAVGSSVLSRGQAMAMLTPCGVLGRPASGQRKRAGSYMGLELGSSLWMAICPQPLPCFHCTSTPWGVPELEEHFGPRERNWMGKKLKLKVRSRNLVLEGPWK